MYCFFLWYCIVFFFWSPLFFIFGKKISIKRRIWRKNLHKTHNLSNFYTRNFLFHSLKRHNELDLRKKYIPVYSKSPQIVYFIEVLLLTPKSPKKQFFKYFSKHLHKMTDSKLFEEKYFPKLTKWVRFEKNTHIWNHLKSFVLLTTFVWKKKLHKSTKWPSLKHFVTGTREFGINFNLFENFDLKKKQVFHLSLKSP